jgi:TonB family protein
MNKLKKVIISFLILNCFILLFSLKAYSHLINATHEYMIDLARWYLGRVEEARYTYDNMLSSILYTELDSKGMATMIMEEGVRDADLRVNGIYAVDGHCKDLFKVTCPEEEKVYNDIPEWIIGDHGYNPETEKGFYSDQEDSYLNERINELLKNFYDPKIEKLKKALGCQKEDQVCFIEKLHSIAQKSNAATIAKLFWERAINEWKRGHEADAMYNLGIAIHLVQDVTVPHHARLIRDAAHEYYEIYVWDAYLKKGDYEHQEKIFKTYLEKGYFEPDVEGSHEKLTAEEWVKRNAKESYKLDLSPDISAEDSVRLAVRSTVGVIRYFFELVLPKLPEPRLQIRKDGTMFLKEEHVTRENLSAAVEEALLNASDKRIYLRADKDLEFGNIVEIIELLKDAGVKEIIISIDEKWWREKIRDIKIPETTWNISETSPDGKLVAPIEIPIDILGPIVLTLHKDMRVDINQKYWKPNRLNNVQEELICIYSARRDKTIFIRAEARIALSKIIELVDIAKAAGAKTIAIIPEYFEESLENLERETEKEAEAEKHEGLAKEVWVMPRIIEELKKGLYIGKKEVFPPKVAIKGPADKIEDVCLVETTPIDISLWTKSDEVEADIILPAPYMKFASSQTKAKVKIIIINTEAAAREAAVSPVRAIGPPPKLIKEVKPIYPEIARKARVEGIVILEVTTDLYGKVQNVKVLKSIPLLDQAAIDAVKQWLYEPMIIDGKPRGVIFTVTVRFVL